MQKNVARIHNVNVGAKGLFSRTLVLNWDFAEFDDEGWLWLSCVKASRISGGVRMRRAELNWPSVSSLWLPN